MKHHPIQLVKVQIKELQIIVDDPAECEKDNLEAQISYRVGANQFDGEEKILMAGFKCLVNTEKDKEEIEFIDLRKENFNSVEEQKEIEKIIENE